MLTKEAARAVREADGVIVPTLSVTRSPEWMKENHFEDWTIEKAVSSGATHLESIRTAIREGARLLVGTDLPAGDESRGVNSTVREIEYLQEAGLAPLGSAASFYNLLCRTLQCGERAGENTTKLYSRCDRSII